MFIRLSCSHQTSGRHLLRLINNVLDLAKIEAGRMELALADYSVQDMVESVRSTLRPLAEAKGLEFNIVVPSDIPLAYGDAGRMTQSLMNLAGNSLKFTKAGQVAISVAAKGDILALRVLDTGIGIDGPLSPFAVKRNSEGPCLTRHDASRRDARCNGSWDVCGNTFLPQIIPRLCCFQIKMNTRLYTTLPREE